jgi:hypothetical protein
MGSVVGSKISVFWVGSNELGFSVIGVGVGCSVIGDAVLGGATVGAGGRGGRGLVGRIEGVVDLGTAVGTIGALLFGAGVTVGVLEAEIGREVEVGGEVLHSHSSSNGAKNSHRSNGIKP